MPRHLRPQPPALVGEELGRASSVARRLASPARAVIAASRRRDSRDPHATLRSLAADISSWRPAPFSYCSGADADSQLPAPLGGRNVLPAERDDLQPQAVLLERGGRFSAGRVSAAPVDRALLGAASQS